MSFDSRFWTADNSRSYSLLFIRMFGLTPTGRRRRENRERPMGTHAKVADRLEMPKMGPN